METEVHKILEVAKAEESPQEMSEKNKENRTEEEASTHAELSDHGLELAADPNDLQLEVDDSEDEVNTDSVEPPARSTRSRRKKSEEGSS